MALDVTDPDAAAAAVATGAKAFGRLDVVVNNAGYANLAAVEDITLAAARARAESDAAWHGLTISTDRDDATASQRDPLARASSWAQTHARTAAIPGNPAGLYQ